MCVWGGGVVVENENQGILIHKYPQQFYTLE